MQVCVYVTGNFHVSELTVTFKYLKGQISSTNADRYELVMLSSFVSDPLLYPLKIWITMQVCVCICYSKPSSISTLLLHLDT